MGRRVLGKIPERHKKYIGQFWPFFAPLLWVTSLGFAYLEKKKLVGCVGPWPLVFT